METKSESVTQAEPSPTPVPTVAEAPVEAAIPVPAVPDIGTPVAPTEPVVIQPPSLRNRIAVAASLQDLDELVALGASETFKFASQKTRNRWAAAAKLRRAELKGRLA